MKDIGTKFRLIFIPYLVIFVTVISVYTFLHWILFIQNNPFSADEDLLSIFIPMLLPGIPLLVWLRPRINYLKFNKPPSGKNPVVAFIMLSWIGMVIPNVIVQHYLLSSTGELTHLADISQINKARTTKYYMVDKFDTDKKQSCKMPETSVSGRRNQSLDMQVLIAVPLFSKQLQKKQEFDVISYDRRSGGYFLMGKKYSSMNSANSTLMPG